MIKGLITVLFLVLVTALPVHSRDEAVAIPYAQAVQRSQRDLLPVLEIDTRIRAFDRQSKNLREELDDLVRGNWLFGEVAALSNELRNIETQLFNLRQSQSRVWSDTNELVQMLIMGIPLGHPDLVNILNEAFVGSVQGVMSVREIDEIINALENRRTSLMSEIMDIQNPRIVADRITDTRRSMDEINRQVRNLRYNQDLLRTAREGSLRNLIVTEVELWASIELLEKSLFLTGENYRIVTAENNLGVASALELRNARQLHLETELELASMRLSHTNAMHSLNHMIGEPLSQFTEIEFDVDGLDIPDNAQRVIARQINAAPSIRQLRITVERARDERDSYPGDDTGNIRHLRDAYQHAVLAYNQGRRAMEAAILRAHNEFNQLGIRLSTRKLELENTKAAYQSAKAHLELGRGTYVDVSRMRVQVFQAGQNIEAVHRQKWVIAFMLNNPSLMVLD